ncbi:MAG: tRNA (adenosine(37)-N6)-threonylcarbamoyltransferase complex dimerization subunit type 1 TsaB [Desulfopila sp.]
MADRNTYMLAVDTATPCATVALTEGTRGAGRVLGAVGVASNTSHSRRLLVVIDRLLTDCAIGKEKIEGFAVGLGPGSFTGLRIGMATMKGLAVAAGKPLFGLSTLDVVAAGCTGTTREICSVLDARKREVYAAFYRLDSTGMITRRSEIVVVSPERLAERINGPVTMTGDGLYAYKDFFTERLGRLVDFSPVQCWSPAGAVLGLMAGELCRVGRSLDPVSAAPLYVRASDAELNLKTMAQQAPSSQVVQKPQS